jgi:hypothetical protein
VIIKNTTNNATTSPGVGKDAGKKESSYTAGWNASWCYHSGKQHGDFLKM